jgi:hypothetical protein
LEDLQMKKTLLLALIPALVAAGPIIGATDWLPEDGQESLAQQVAVKLADTHLGNEENEEQRLSRARVAVGSMMSTIDSWGPTGVAERAPALEELALPVSEHPYLNAIASYGACTLHLDALYGNRGLDESAPSIRALAAIASAAIPLATAILRHHYLAEGGTDDELRAFLTSDEITSASLRIKNDRDLISYSWEECAPTLGELTNAIPRSDESSGEGS